MPSDLSAIYDALADIDVGIEGDILTVYKPTNVIVPINNVVLPVRILMPFSKPATSPVTKLVLSGVKALVDWQIHDIILYETYGTSNLQQQAYNNILLQSSYINAMLGNFRLIPTVAEITNMQFSTGIMPYGDDSDVEYYGLSTQVTIREIVKSS